MNTIRPLAFLVLTASLVLATTKPEPTFEPPQEPHDDWKEDHYVVYAQKGEDDKLVSTQRTLELLERLQELYRTRDDEGSRTRFERVSALIDVSHISERKCTKGALEHMYKLMIKHSVYPVNVAPYLLAHSKRQLALCHKFIEFKVTQTDESQFGDVLRLSEHITSALESGGERKHRRDLSAQMAQAVVNFIEEQRGLPLEEGGEILEHEQGPNTESRVAALVRRTVGRACNQLREELNSVLELCEISTISCDHKLPEHWTLASARCNVMNINSAEILKSAGKIVKQRRGQAADHLAGGKSRAARWRSRLCLGRSCVRE